MMKSNRLLFFLLLFLSVACSNVRYCYFVRHAEKLDSTPNSVLSQEGQQRAMALKEMLASKKIELIFSTNYKRTKETVQPLADALQKQVLLYKPNNVDSLVAIINQAENKNILVVGHSNTLPPLIEKLSGTKIQAIKETEFDNFYILKIGKPKRVLIQKKYGVTHH